MWEVLITIAERPTKDYPFAVVIKNPNDHHRPVSQEILCRSVRDCYLVANGALMFGRYENANYGNLPNGATLDERLKGV